MDNADDGGQISNTISSAKLTFGMAFTTNYTYIHCKGPSGRLLSKDGLKWDRVTKAATS